jgi:anti-anti-sigma regulatory factor
MPAKESKKVALAGSYTVERASELRDQLLEALNASDVLDLDISGLTGGDLALLQVLCSAQKTCAAKGKTVRPSQPLHERLGEIIQSSGLEQTCCLCSEQSCFIRQG